MISNYFYRNNIQKKVFYHGIDINSRWENIHEVIKQSVENDWEVKYEYGNINEYFTTYYYENYNLLFMQYLISHFINLDVDPASFFLKLIDIFIRYMDLNSTIIINDLNSCNRGRDNICMLLSQMNEFGIKYTVDARYFDTGIKNDMQRIGEKYQDNKIFDYSTNVEFNDKYNPWSVCSSFQIIIKDIKVM